MGVDLELFDEQSPKVSNLEASNCSIIFVNYSAIMMAMIFSHVSETDEEAS